MQRTENLRSLSKDSVWIANNFGIHPDCDYALMRVRFIYPIDDNVGNFIGQISRQARDLEHPAAKCLSYSFAIAFFRFPEEVWSRYASFAKTAP